MQDSFFVCLKFYSDNFQNQLDKLLLRGYILHILASPSSRGLGHRVLIPATWVRIPLEMPFFLSFFPRIVSNPCKKQRLASANKFAHQELDAIVFAMPPSATGIPLLNFYFADMLTIHVIDRLTPFHIAINKIKELLWAQKKSCYC